MRDILDIIKAWAVIIWGGMMGFCQCIDRVYPELDNVIALAIAILTILALVLRIRQDWPDRKDKGT